MTSIFTWHLLFHILSTRQKPTNDGGLSVCLWVAKTGLITCFQLNLVHQYACSKFSSVGFYIKIFNHLFACLACICQESFWKHSHFSWMWWMVFMWKDLTLTYNIHQQVNIFLSNVCLVNHWNCELVTHLSLLYKSSFCFSQHHSSSNLRTMTLSLWSDTFLVI